MLPVLVLVAFSAVIPLMTVVNYSVQDTFGNNQFFWAGLEWFEELLEDDRMWNALGRQPAVFSAIILAIQIPLGIFRGAAACPKKGSGRIHVCLVLMALPLLIPWNVVGTIWQMFRARGHRAARATRSTRSGSNTTTPQDPVARLDH